MTESIQARIGQRIAGTILPLALAGSTYLQQNRTKTSSGLEQVLNWFFLLETFYLDGTSLWTRVLLAWIPDPTVCRPLYFYSVLGCIHVKQQAGGKWIRKVLCIHNTLQQEEIYY
ncbi:hypothetical protein C7R93_02240 [Brevibacillus fortis]|uniref:Uncharacterized protein n=1 Tax=Brevibacillus fortis TaxID=2126352 RepID=A0A2P7VJZ4_9BACL|nr:hypothetical protein C7R93_02240 [Brevibacillus fortis]